jgi:hypothetical protein
VWRGPWSPPRDRARALDPFLDLAAQAERILTLPAKTIDTNLSTQPPTVCQQAQGPIDAAVEGLTGA